MRLPRSPNSTRWLPAILLLAAGLPSLAAAVTVPGQPVNGPGLSPVVTWDPELVYGGVARTPTSRPMTPAEARLSRERAERVFEALKAAPAFSRPERHATSLSSWAYLPTRTLLSQFFVCTGRCRAMHASARTAPTSR